MIWTYHEQLWSGVGRAAAEGCEVLLHGLQPLGEPEVAEQDLIPRAEEHVLGFDVPVSRDEYLE